MPTLAELRELMKKVDAEYEAADAKWLELGGKESELIEERDERIDKMIVFYLKMEKKGETIEDYRDLPYEEQAPIKAKAERSGTVRLMDAKIKKIEPAANEAYAEWERATKEQDRVQALLDAAEEEERKKFAPPKNIEVVALMKSLNPKFFGLVREDSKAERLLKLKYRQKEAIREIQAEVAAEKPNRVRIKKTF